MKREKRAVGASEIRIVGDDSERQFEAVVCRYNVVDSWGTIWNPGCWTASLRSKLPKCVWSHNWEDPIGRVVAYDDNDERLVVTVQLSDFDAVPRARQAWAQLRDGDIDNFSFGFVRREWVTIQDDEEEGSERMIRADMDEVSPVLVGAVPGTQTLAVRSVAEKGARISVEVVEALAVRLAAGEIDLQEALTAIKEEAQPETEPAETETQPTETPADEPEEDPEMVKELAEIDRALDVAYQV